MAASSATIASSSSSTCAPMADGLRASAILHVDVDCFYVQVELVRAARRGAPIDPDRPVAVTQKQDANGGCKNKGW